MSDLISRKAAIKAIRKDMYADKDFMSAMICEGIEDVLNALPSAEPNEQIKWERDTAIQQLADLGYGLGEKPRGDDCISRKAAIMHFVKAAKKYECGMFDLEEATHELWKVPSAEPERKKGFWIIENEFLGDCIDRCSVCGWKYSYYGFDDERDDYNFCPNCGADMRGEEDGQG